MIRLILMRHGNTFEEGQTPLQVGARTDLALTKFGLFQAEQMAQFLQKNGLVPKAVFAGPLKRQIQSAEKIADTFGLKLQQESALAEIDYGDWEGLTADQIVSKWPKEYAEWNQEAKWQSHIFSRSAEEHWNALAQWFLKLESGDEGKTIVGVTSNGLLRFFKNEKVKTGHFCELLLDRGKFQISAWNQKPA